MIIKLQIEEEVMVRRGDFDIAIPFSVTKHGRSDEWEVTSFFSLREKAAALVRRYPGDAIFSERAISAVKQAFGGFLDAHGFEMGEESDDFFRLYRLERPDTGCVQSSTRALSDIKGLSNLTGYDLAVMKKYGHLCYGTVLDGKIVSVACTNAPMGKKGGMEIGVETAPGYEGRGFGKSNVSALAAALRERGCTALYECASKNTASVRLAERIGGIESARNYYIVGRKED